MNKQAEKSLWETSAPADTSFVTGAAVLHDERSAIEVVYSGLDAADATIQLKASISNDINKARNLTFDPCTLTTANSSLLFNIGEIGYTYIHVVYDAGSNSTGAISLNLARKQKS